MDSVKEFLINEYLIKRYLKKRYKVYHIVYDNLGFVTGWNLLEKETDLIVSPISTSKFLSDIFSVDSKTCNSILKIVLDEHIETLKANQIKLTI